MVCFVSLDPNNVNILSQVRKKFEQESLDILATDIATNGLINMPNIIFYKELDAYLYIKTINTIHNSNHSVSKMKMSTWKGEKGYFFLVAGERRSRSFIILKEKGCLRCRNNKKELIDLHGGYQVCFRSHFKNEHFEFQYKVMEGISPFKALNIQMSENLYEKPNSHSEAVMYASYYKLLKIVNPDYTIAKFSRRVARNPNLLRGLIGYCDLPQKIQNYVEEGYVRFGIAKQLVRLRSVLFRLKKDDSFISEKINSSFIRAMTSNLNVKKFTKFITQVIENERMSQVSLLDLMSQSYSKPDYAKVTNKLTRKAVQGENLYIKGIIKLLDDGFLNSNHGIFQDEYLIDELKEFSKVNKNALDKATQQNLRLVVDK